MDKEIRTIEDAADAVAHMRAIMRVLYKRICALEQELHPTDGQPAEPATLRNILIENSDTEDTALANTEDTLADDEF